MTMPSALDIARAATLRPVTDVAREMGISEDFLEPYGRHIAKIKLEAIDSLADLPRAKYVVV